MTRMVSSTVLPMMTGNDSVWSVVSPITITIGLTSSAADSPTTRRTGSRPSVRAVASAMRKRAGCSAAAPNSTKIGGARAWPRMPSGPPTVARVTTTSCRKITITAEASSR